MSFGSTLKQLRKSKKITQRELAGAIQMDMAYLSRLENDQTNFNPTHQTIEKFVQGLQCSPQERAELLTAAARVDTDIEQLLLAARNRPDLKPLLQLLLTLPADKVPLVMEFILNL